MRKVILLFLTIVMFIPHNMINSQMSEEEVADIIIEKKHIPYDVVQLQHIRYQKVKPIQHH